MWTSGASGAGGIDAALEAGFGPIKINMVVKRGVNEQEIIPMARRFSGSSSSCGSSSSWMWATPITGACRTWCRPRRLWRRTEGVSSGVAAPELFREVAQRFGMLKGTGR